jgi:xanthine dehydrogenase accessory factor
MLKDYLEKTQELSRRNEPFALAVVVRREEPSSGKAGDKAVINQYGEIIGWVGGGCVRAIIIKEAEDAMRSGMPRLVRIGKHLTNEKKHGGVMEYKMTCQSEGMVEVFIEPVLPPPHLVVVGKSAIARALVRMAKASGFRVTAMADEAKVSTFEKPDELITRLSFQQVACNPLSSIVVATQGEDDEKALAEALQQPHVYLGFVASHKKKASVFQYLKDMGMDEEKVNGIHSPAGIDIHAKRPEEVAISILAEVIQVRNSTDLPHVFTSLDSSRGEAGKPKFYINPVCGVPVDVNHPKHVIEYGGESVYFCCDGCKVKFEADPDKYMKKEKA